MPLTNKKSSSKLLLTFMLSHLSGCLGLSSNHLLNGVLNTGLPQKPLITVPEGTVVKTIPRNLSCTDPRGVPYSSATQVFSITNSVLIQSIPVQESSGNCTARATYRLGTWNVVSGGYTTTAQLQNLESVGCAFPSVTLDAQADTIDVMSTSAGYSVKLGALAAAKTCTAF